MEITTDLVKHLAEISRLEFEASELENFKNEFEKTLEYVDQISKVQTENVELKNNKLNAETELRKDETQQGLTKEEVLKNAPESLGSSIVVPKMVD